MKSIKIITQLRDSVNKWAPILDYQKPMTVFNIMIFVKVDSIVSMRINSGQTFATIMDKSLLKAGHRYRVSLFSMPIDLNDSISVLSDQLGLEFIILGSTDEQ
jgi:hypothetical protein